MVDHAAGPADREAYRRDCVIDKAQYLSREFADAEAEHLWPRVWQVACREEEIPRPGNYIAYDIVDDSIIVTRGEDEEIRSEEHTSELQSLMRSSYAVLCLNNKIATSNPSSS